MVKWAVRGRHFVFARSYLSKKKILVAGAGGFIGGHLVGDLLRQGHTVRAVDVKPFDRWYQRFPDAESRVGDMSLLEDARNATSGMEWVYNLAADMGGMGFIENNKALCMLSVLTSTHVLMGLARRASSGSFTARAPAFITQTSSVIPMSPH